MADTVQSTRQMFQQKLRQYWLTVIEECRNDPRALWTKVQCLLSVPSSGDRSQLSAEDLSSHFVSKVNRIRTVTAGAARPVNARTASSIAADPAPNWLVKCSADVLAPVFAAICNASLESEKFPDMYKQANVFLRLKKSTLDADNANSYRPISNLSFVSKLVERVIAACKVFRARGA